jgi:hypothetical protein
MIKKIYFFWYQGIKDAPIIVKKCLESWIYYNYDWEIIILDYLNYNLFCDLENKIDLSKISLNHFSDILRLSILNKYGGLWVDATCFCNCSLNTWLPLYLSNDFFMFDNLTQLGHMISSWFIYSEPNTYLISIWYKNILETYNNEIEKFSTTYFIQYQLFDELYLKDDIFKNEWNKVPKIKNHNNNMIYFDLYKKGKLYIKNNGFLEPLTSNVKKIILGKEKFVFKLSYKCDYDEKYNDKTILSFLFSTIKNNI